MSVFVQINDERIELHGEEAEAQLAHGQRLENAFKAAQQLAVERLVAKQSAVAKLKTLDLTDAEIAALLGA